MSIQITDNSKNPIIIFDTNFLLLPEQFKVDIFEKTKEILSTQNPIFCIFDKTIDELSVLSKDKSKHSLAAKIGLQLVKKLEKSKNITIINTLGTTNYVDNLILNYKKHIKPKTLSNFYIATQDKELKLKLKEEKIKVIILAQRNILKVF